MKAYLFIQFGMMTYDDVFSINDQFLLIIQPAHSQYYSFSVFTSLIFLYGH